MHANTKNKGASEFTSYQDKVKKRNKQLNRDKSYYLINVFHKKMSLTNGMSWIIKKETEGN